jgi:hypothetical protein
VRQPAESQPKPKPKAYVGPDAEGPFRGVCTAAFGFCCRTAPLPPLPPPPPVEPLIQRKVSSKFYGVGWHNGKKKWQAQFRHNGKNVNLGDSFDTELAAAKAVDVWLRENGRAAEANLDESGNFVPRVSTKSSKYRGVSWAKSHNQWEAIIRVAGTQQHLGYFDDEKEAAKAYDTRARQLVRLTNFDENGVEIDYGSNAVLQAQAAQAAAWDAEIVRNAAEAAASAVAGNLTKGRRELIKSGPSAAVAMLTAAAPKFAKQEEAREKVDENVRATGGTTISEMQIAVILDRRL